MAQMMRRLAWLSVIGGVGAAGWKFWSSQRAADDRDTGNWAPVPAPAGGSAGATTTSQRFVADAGVSSDSATNGSHTSASSTTGDGTSGNGKSAAASTRSASAGSTAKKSPTKSSSANTSAAKKSTAEKSTPEKSSAKQSPAKKSTAAKSTAAKSTVAKSTVAGSGSSKAGVSAGKQLWVEPGEKGTCPADFPVKANQSSKIYHVPTGTSYRRTKAERCYATPEDAESDGYRASKR